MRRTVGLISPDAGVSLVELLVVLGILALVLTVAAPALRSSKPSVELRPMAASLAAELRLARSTAVSTSSDIAFVFEPKSRSYWTEASTRRTVLPPAIQLTLKTARQKVRETGEAQLIFFADGSSSGGSITLQHDARTIVVAVDWLSGAVTFERSP